MNALANRDIKLPFDRIKNEKAILCFGKGWKRERKSDIPKCENRKCFHNRKALPA